MDVKRACREVLHAPQIEPHTQASLPCHFTSLFHGWLVVGPGPLRPTATFEINSVGARVASFAAHSSQTPPSEKSSAASAILSTLKGGSARVSNKSCQPESAISPAELS